MAAFLSSTQMRELAQEKAIIELDVAGYGLVTVNENVKCEYCGKHGRAEMPHGVVGCIHCTRMDFTKAGADASDTEYFRTLLEAVPQMLAEAKKYYHERYGRRRR